MKAMKIYGIANCDTVKRARAWLSAQGVSADWVDFKKAGAPPALLQTWLDAGLPWSSLVNRQGTTWRKLSAEQQAAVVDAKSAVALLTQHTSLIKRPVVEWPDGKVTVGFVEADWAQRCA